MVNRNIRSVATPMDRERATVVAVTGCNGGGGKGAQTPTGRGPPGGPRGRPAPGPGGRPPPAASSGGPARAGSAWSTATLDLSQLPWIENAQGWSRLLDAMAGATELPSPRGVEPPAMSD